MKVRACHNLNQSHWALTFLDGLVETCPRVEIERVKHRTFTSASGVRYEVRKCIVLAAESGQFDVIDPADMVGRSNSRFLEGDEYCRKILKCQYRPGMGCKWVPYVYTAKHPNVTNHLLAELRSTVKRESALHWRGTLWKSRRRILTAMGLEIPQGKLPFEDYLREIARHRMMLALPGWGNVCHREFEAFAAGTTVLMPRLKNTFADPLVPNVHYVSVDANTTVEPAERVGEKIRMRYREVERDFGYLETVRQAAMDWYDRNCIREQQGILTARLLEWDRTDLER